MRLPEFGDRVRHQHGGEQRRRDDADAAAPARGMIARATRGVVQLVENAVGGILEFATGLGQFDAPRRAI